MSGKTIVLIIVFCVFVLSYFLMKYNVGDDDEPFFF